MSLTTLATVVPKKDEKKKKKNKEGDWHWVKKVEDRRQSMLLHVEGSTPIGATATPIVFYLSWVRVCVGRVVGQW